MKRLRRLRHKSFMLQLYGYTINFERQQQGISQIMYINWLIKPRHDSALNARLVPPVASIKVLVLAQKMTYKSHN